MVALSPNTFFFFQPEHSQKFAFTTHLKNDPALANKGGRGLYRNPELRIEPEEMITNGNNIPRALWYIPGFGPFDFTRAAVIHDWLFEAHHRYTMADAAFRAARARHDVAAMRRSGADKEAYKLYRDLHQEDAADIFAECIKVSMIQSQEVNEAIKSYPANPSDPNHPSSAFKELKASLQDNRPRPATLWAYHYFVSPDAIIKTSKKLWDEKQSTIDTYRFLTSPEVEKIGLQKGFLSPWLLARFRRILKREQDRHRDFERSQLQPAPPQTEQSRKTLQ